MEHYLIKVDAGRRIVELRLSAKMTAEDHAKAREDLLAACREHRIRRILIDAGELATQPTTTQLFEFASGWPALLRQTPVVVAGVLPREVAVRQWWRFGDDVASNRGLISHAFQNVEEASLAGSLVTFSPGTSGPSGLASGAGRAIRAGRSRCPPSARLP